jgi:hypothetical protein
MHIWVIHVINQILECRYTIVLDLVCKNTQAFGFLGNVRIRILNLELRVASKDLPLNQVKRKEMCLRYRRKRPEYLLPHAIEARTLVSTLSKIRCQKIVSEEVQCKHDTIVPCGERIANLSYSEVLLACLQAFQEGRIYSRIQPAVFYSPSIYNV